MEERTMKKLLLSVILLAATPLVYAMGPNEEPQKQGLKDFLKWGKEKLKSYQQQHHEEKCKRRISKIFNYLEQGEDLSLYAQHKLEKHIDTLRPYLDTYFYGKNGDSLLGMAIRKKRPEMASLLMNNGANPNHQNYNGETPLSFAINRNDTTMATRLFAVGAHIDEAFNRSGKLAIDEVKASTQDNMYAVLRRHENKILTKLTATTHLPLSVARLTLDYLTQDPR